MARQEGIIIIPIQDKMWLDLVGRGLVRLDAA